MKVGKENKALNEWICLKIDELLSMFWKCFPYSAKSAKDNNKYLPKINQFHEKKCSESCLFAFYIFTLFCIDFINSKYVGIMYLNLGLILHQFKVQLNQNILLLSNACSKLCKSHRT